MASISVQEQDKYPPQVLISVTSLTIGDDVEIYREVGGVRTLVRAASETNVTDTSFLRVDAELPFGVPVTYVAIINGSTQLTAGPNTYVLASGKTVLTDAVGGASAEALVNAEDPRRYSRESTVFRVGGKNITDAGPGGQYESSLELVTESATSFENVLQLLRTATQGIIQIRNNIGNRNDYVHVSSWETRWYSKDRTDEMRYIVLNVVETDGWASILEASSFTLQDIADYYGTSGTLQDIADDFTTLLDIAQADFS